MAAYNISLHEAIYSLSVMSIFVANSCTTKKARLHHD